MFIYLFIYFLALNTANGAVNKTWIGLLIESDSGSDQIESDSNRIRSDWYLRFWCRIIIMRKAVLTMIQIARNTKSEFSQHKSNWFNSDFFFQAACVTNKKKIVSHVSPGLKFTISLKIIATNYFQLNCTGKFFCCITLYNYIA